MTEDEAKTKWCPFARRHPVMPYNGPVSNGLGYSTNAPPVDREAHCIASACMAWRWKPGNALFEQEEREQEERPTEPEAANWRRVDNYLMAVRPTKWVRDIYVEGRAVNGGHCGLAGAPQ